MRAETILIIFSLSLSGSLSCFRSGLNLGKGLRIAHRYASGQEDTVFGVKAVSLFITDLSTSSGKASYLFLILPEDTEVLQCLRYNADDASCLNLNKGNEPYGIRDKYESVVK